jgi:PPOX class probable F420-dependent enzyme
MDEPECWRRLGEADHAVLGTTNPERGPDLVPVVFAVQSEPEPRLLVPIDTVKPKSVGRLQRLANLDRDPRCTLLVEHYEHDWQQLWWVRVHAEAAEVPVTDQRLAPLVARYEAYAEPGAVTSVLVLRPTLVRGWSAT